MMVSNKHLRFFNVPVPILLYRDKKMMEVEKRRTVRRKRKTR